jgi:C-terminal binding protein
LTLILAQDESIEQQIFKPHESQQYDLNYQQTHLWPTGVPNRKPWSDVDKALRDEVDGIMVLKMGFTAADLELFPKLKV